MNYRQQTIAEYLSYLNYNRQQMKLIIFLLCPPLGSLLEVLSGDKPISP